MHVVKRHISRNFQKEYIFLVRIWNVILCINIFSNGYPEIAAKLLWLEERWPVYMSSKGLSRKDWSLLRKLGWSNFITRNIYVVIPKEVAERIVTSSRPLGDRSHIKKIKHELNNLINESPDGLVLSRPLRNWTSNEKYKNQLSPRFRWNPKWTHHEYWPRTRRWLPDLFTDIFNTNYLPKELKNTEIIAVLETGKPKNNVEIHRSIADLNACYKFLNRLVLEMIKHNGIDHISP